RGPARILRRGPHPDDHRRAAPRSKQATVVPNAVECRSCATGVSRARPIFPEMLSYKTRVSWRRPRAGNAIANANIAGEIGRSSVSIPARGGIPSEIFELAPGRGNLVDAKIARFQRW